MLVQRALAAFKTERLNCAESILRAFQQQMGLSEQTIQQATQLGGGRAEEGRCGALHAVLILIDDEGMRSSVREAFVTRAGAEKCRDIRKRKSLSCAQCVELAATLLSEHRGGTKKSEQGCL